MPRNVLITILTLCFVTFGAGCSQQSKSPDVRDNIKKSLEQAGLKDVKVDEDRDKGVVKLTGEVKTDDEKAQAENIAKAAAGNLVVSDEIAVRPPGFESESKKIQSDLDTAIEKNLQAALISQKLDKGVKYKAQNGVITLTGEVNSQTKRAEIEKLAASVPNVQQVVNELEVKGQKATARR